MPFVKGKSGNPKGKPLGATTKPRLSDYITEEQVTTLVNKAIELASGGNDTMLKFVLEQHFGKAVQPVEGNMKGNITIVFDKSFHDSTPTPTDSSQE